MIVRMSVVAYLDTLHLSQNAECAHVCVLSECIHNTSMAAFICTSSGNFMYCKRHYSPPFVRPAHTVYDIQ